MVFIVERPTSPLYFSFSRVSSLSSDSIYFPYLRTSFLQLLFVSRPPLVRGSSLVSISFKVYISTSSVSKRGSTPLAGPLALPSVPFAFVAAL